MKTETSSNPYKTSDEINDHNEIFDNPTTAKRVTQKAPAWLFSDQARNNNVGRAGKSMRLLVSTATI
jgi:hypothetical protein